MVWVHSLDQVAKSTMQPGLVYLSWFRLGFFLFVSGHSQCSRWAPGTGFANLLSSHLSWYVVLRKMTEVVAKPLPMTFENSWQSCEVHSDWEKENTVSVSKMWRKEDPGNCWPISPTSLAGKITEKILLEAMLRYTKERELIWDSKHSYTKGKSCLINLVAFYGGMTASETKQELASFIL